MITPALPSPVRPYGLRHQVPVLPALREMPPGMTYDPAAQLNLIDGRPLVDQPHLMALYTVTWSTTGNDNKTDAGG